MTRLPLLATLVLCLIASSALAAPDGSDWWPIDWKDQTWPIDFDPVSPRTDDGAFYEKVAQPVRDEASTTAKGVAWQLETDTKTGIAYPRILSLPDKRPVEAANRSLRAVHGWLIRSALAHARWRDARDEARIAVLPDSRSTLSKGDSGRYTDQKVDVTYASTAYLGVLETGVYAGEDYPDMQSIRGLTFDLRRGTFFGLQPCLGPERLGFTFGDLLVVCSAPQLRTFFYTWLRRYRHALLEIGGRGCEYAPGHQPVPGYFSLHLTEKGLAVTSLARDVHRPTRSVTDASACKDPQSDFNPIVIPYAEIADLLQPGPLRDELLARR